MIPIAHRRRAEWARWVAGGLGIVFVTLVLPAPRGTGAVAGVGIAAVGLLLVGHRGRDDGRASEARVRAVLADDEGVMHFQPIVWMPTGEVVGYEGLARFPTPPDRPDQWFALAGRCSLRVELELAAVRKGLDALWVTPLDCYVSLNVSPETLLSEALLETLSDCPGDRIVLELTEHVPIADYGVYLPCVEALRRRGVRLAVDDAGAGYSSLRHILVLRPDIIKLDRSLTAGANDDPVRRALLTCLATFAHATRTTLVAEGVETIDEMAALVDHGVAFGQGYYFGRPQPLDTLSTQHRVAR